MWECLYVIAISHEIQKRASDPMELNLQSSVSHPAWPLGSEFMSATRIIQFLLKMFSLIFENFIYDSLNISPLPHVLLDPSPHYTFTQLSVLVFKNPIEFY